MIVSSVLVRALYMVRSLAIGAILALGLGVPAASPATAAPSVSTYDTGAHTYDAPPPLSSPDTVASDERGSPSGPVVASWARSVSFEGCGVAANTGADLVLYSRQAESRNLLGQLGEGFATTPGGRTVGAHAADRIVNGAAGRAPTTLARVDEPMWRSAVPGRASTSSR